MSDNGDGYGKDSKSDILSFFSLQKDILSYLTHLSHPILSAKHIVALQIVTQIHTDQDVVKEFILTLERT